MSFYPVLARELRAEMQGRRLHKGRVVSGLIFGLGLAVLILLDRQAGGFNVARFLTVVPVLETVPFLLLVIGLNRAGTILSVERREGTLPLLLLTRLTGNDIVLGKLLQALVVELNSFLAILPALVLPLIAAGVQLNELCLMVLGYLNVLFFATALGLFGSVFGDGPKAVSWCLILIFPIVMYSPPFGRLLPAGPVRDVIAALQWLNPCHALEHVQMAVAGFRRGPYWSALLTSHAVGWGLVVLAGLLLPNACRRQAGFNARPLSAKRKRWWHLGPAPRPAAWRASLLNRNPFHWLMSRERWPTAQVWLWLTISGVGWGWLAWAARSFGVTFVMVIGVAALWHIALFTMIPSEASRRWVEDRQNGALEMILCTPIGVAEMVRGQWLSLGRRYGAAILIVILGDTALMVAGYVTYGFGGMLDPADRGLWLFLWLVGIFLLPLCLTALIWVAMRRSLFARNIGEASGIAIVQIMVLTGITLWAEHELRRLAGWTQQWWWSAVTLTALYAAILVVLARRARRLFLDNLRQATARKYSEDDAILSRASRP
jgi:ABC-type Na+ efflux pump permease subunit